MTSTSKTVATFGRSDPGTLTAGDDGATRLETAALDDQLARTEARMAVDLIEAKYGWIGEKS